MVFPNGSLLSRVPTALETLNPALSMRLHMDTPIREKISLSMFTARRHKQAEVEKDLNQVENA